MRVPRDFDAPLNEIWKGYMPSKELLKTFPVHSCDDCRKLYEGDADFCQEEATPYCIYYNPLYRDQWYHEPPKGEGYQLWETTSEGSPISPVFASAEELAAWCESGATIFASVRLPASEWLEMFKKEDIYYRAGNVIFI